MLLYVSYASCVYQMAKRTNNVVKRQRIEPSSVYVLLIVYISTYRLNFIIRLPETTNQSSFNDLKSKVNGVKYILLF